MILLGYWGFQFAVRAWRDRAIRRERVTLVRDWIGGANRRMQKLAARKRRRENAGDKRPFSNQTELTALERFFKQYEAQESRAGMARRLTDFLGYVDWIPTAAVAVLAATICILRLSPSLRDLLNFAWLWCSC